MQYQPSDAKVHENLQREVRRCWENRVGEMEMGRNNPDVVLRVLTEMIAAYRRRKSLVLGLLAAFVLLGGIVAYTLPKTVTFRRVLEPSHYLAITGTSFEFNKRITAYDRADVVIKHFVDPKALLASLQMIIVPAAVRDYNEKSPPESHIRVESIKTSLLEDGRHVVFALDGPLENMDRYNGLLNDVLKRVIALEAPLVTARRKYLEEEIARIDGRLSKTEQRVKIFDTELSKMGKNLFRSPPATGANAFLVNELIDTKLSQSLALAFETQDLVPALKESKGHASEQIQSIESAHFESELGYTPNSTVIPRWFVVCLFAISGLVIATFVLASYAIKNINLFQLGMSYT